MEFAGYCHQCEGETNYLLTKEKAWKVSTPDSGAAPIKLGMLIKRMVKYIINNKTKYQGKSI